MNEKSLASPSDRLAVDGPELKDCKFLHALSLSMAVSKVQPLSGS